MKGKVGFLIGAAVGYLFGTRAGRQQYEKLKQIGRSAWENPKVQERVAQAESKIGDVVREQGGQVTDKVAEMVKNRIGSPADERPASGSGRRSTTAQAPAEPQPNWDTPES